LAYAKAEYTEQKGYLCRFFLAYSSPNEARTCSSIY